MGFYFMNKPEFNKKLRDLGLTQGQFAKLIGMSRTSVCSMGGRMTSIPKQTELVINLMTELQSIENNCGNVDQLDELSVKQE